MNVCEIHAAKLDDLGLNLVGRNVFEIHEKEGPPKSIKVDSSRESDEFISNYDLNHSSFDYSYENNKNDTNIHNNNNNNSNNNNNNEELPMLEPISYTSLTSSNSRRNASSELCDLNTGNMSSLFSYDDDQNSGYVGLINQAMTCYLNSLLQTLYMTPEFRNAIYRWKFIESSKNANSAADEDDGGIFFLHTLKFPLLCFFY
jgi:uncharacterized UBP type Zn finger protein